MRSGKTRSLLDDEEGTAIIEAAVVLPVLITLIFGVLEFSWLICQRHLIATGVYDAARYIAQSASPNEPIVKTAAKRLAATGAVDGMTPRVTGWSADDIDISYDFFSNPITANGVSMFRGGAVIETVVVSTSVTLPSLGFFSLLGLKPPRLTVMHQERVIGSS